MRAILSLILFGMLALSVSADPNDADKINPKDCGRRLDKFPNGRKRDANGNKIVGGVDATPGDFNWQVTLYSRGSFICGGSLINSAWVVTAAHCITPTQVLNYTAHLGLHNLNQPESWARLVGFDKAFNHPSYNQITLRNDISLLRLNAISRILTYSTYIAPVCLSNNVEKYANGAWKAIASGWGTTTSGGQISTILQEVELVIIRNSVCASEYQRFDNATMVCAGEGDGMDTCQGDSGGPLVVEDDFTSNGNSEPKSSMLIGITSWGRGCATAPGVYSRVSSFIGFIESTIQENRP